MQFIFDGPKKVSTDLIDRITRCCEGLVYISETDAPVELFAASAVDSLDADTMRAIAHVSHDTRIEEREFKSFFARLQTKKFLELKNMLEENLSELRVFKIGEIRVTIYAVGLDKNNNVIGVSMRAVET